MPTWVGIDSHSTNAVGENTLAAFTCKFQLHAKRLDLLPPPPHFFFHLMIFACFHLCVFCCCCCQFS